IPAPPGWEPPTKRNLTSALPGVAALGTSGGLRGSAGPTRNRALRLQGASTSIRRQHHHSAAAGLPAGFIQGGSAAGRWKTRNDEVVGHCERSEAISVGDLDDLSSDAGALDDLFLTQLLDLTRADSEPTVQDLGAVLSERRRSFEPHGPAVDPHRPS